MSELRRWQRATLATLVVGYAGYYLCRSNFSVALPLIADELGARGLDAASARGALGDVASLGVLAYALGKFASGVVTERTGGCRAFLAGAGLSALCTLGFAASGTLPLFTIAWIANRSVQSMGWVGAVKLASRWFRAASYGTAMGVISLSYLFGDAIARGAMGALLARGATWRMLFVFAAVALAVILAASAWLLRESPRERGLPEPDAIAEEAASADLGASLRALVADAGFRWICAISLGLTLVRETFNTWTPTYFVDMGLAPSHAAAASAVFPLLGGVSVLLTGWLSDRAGERGLLLAGGVALASVALLALAAAGAPTPALAIALVGATGFLSIGPYSLLAGAISLDFGGKRASAAAAGMIDGVGYLGGVLAGGGVAALAGRFGWRGAFATLAGVAFATALAAWRFHALRPQRGGEVAALESGV
jgi:OPA family glycerol-3-phosphate transporter-like MFS transporter